MDAIRSHKNILTEKIDSIDYTHLLGYPSEVVAVEIITMVKDIIGSETNMKETNMEHFRGEIEAAGYIFGKVNRMIVKCKDIDCRDCDFKNKCAPRRIKWLMLEYNPEPVLTAREKGFVECISDGWLIRNKDNELVWHDEKPEKSMHGYYWISSADSNVATVHEDYFPFITWEDEEPWAVEDLRKLKVKAGDQDET